MSITQGQWLVRDYASRFETLLRRLDSYDESMMLNLFIWGLQPELARSVSLQYPKNIAQAVSLAETTELAVKASRRLAMKTGPSGNGQKGPSTSNRGRGFSHGGMGRGRMQRSGRAGNFGGRGRGSSGRRGEEVAAPILIHWLVISVGCLAIWPVTVPPPTASRWEVAQAALPV